MDDGHDPKRVVYSGSRFAGALAEDVYMQGSLATVLTANNARLEQSAAGIVIAEKVEAESSACLFLLAGEVHGEVRPLFSTAGALIVAGAVLIGWGLWGRAHRR